VGDYLAKGLMAALTAATIASVPDWVRSFPSAAGDIGRYGERLEALSAAHPEIAEAHRGLAEAHEQRGERQQALEELRVAIRINANDAETYFDLGKIELAGGSASAAVTALETAVRMAPNEAEYHRELSNAYKRAFRMGDAEKEHRIYEQLLSTPAAASVDSAKP